MPVNIKVVDHQGKLRVGTALHEQHLISIRNRQQSSKMRLCAAGNCHEIIATMTHLKHGQTPTLIVKQFILYTFQYRLRHCRRTCIEIGKTHRS